MHTHKQCPTDDEVVIYNSPEYEYKVISGQVYRRAIITPRPYPIDIHLYEQFDRKIEALESSQEPFKAKNKEPEKYSTIVYRSRLYQPPLRPQQKSEPALTPTTQEQKNSNWGLWCCCFSYCSKANTTNEAFSLNVKSTSHKKNQ